MRTLAAQVRDRADATLPAWLDDYADVLTPELRADIAVWRAAQGIPPDERTIAGPAPDDDRAAAYRRSLIRTVNSRYDDAVRVWERRVVAYVGRADEHTLDLARELDRLKRQGRDPRAFADEGEYQAAAVRTPDRGARVPDPQAARTKAATPRGTRCRPPPPGAFTAGAQHRDVNATSAV